MLDQKQYEEAIVLDRISDGVITIGFDMNIRYMNRAMRELLGYQPEEILGQPVSCHLRVQGTLCSTQDCILDRAVRNREKVRNYETVIQNKDGRKIPVSLNTDLLRDSSGHLNGNLRPRGRSRTVALGHPTVPAYVRGDRNMAYSHDPVSS